MVRDRSFKKGLEQMGDMVGEVREQLNASMESLGWKVDAGLRHQRLMGEDVRRARDHVQHLEALVLSMEGRLHDSIVRASLLSSPVLDWLGIPAEAQPRSQRRWYRKDSAGSSRPLVDLVKSC